MVLPIPFFDQLGILVVDSVSLEGRNFISGKDSKFPLIQSYPQASLKILPNSFYIFLYLLPAKNRL
jgi:hypothetical protein